MFKIVAVLISFLLTSTLCAQEPLTLRDTISSYFKEARIATKRSKKLWDKDIYGPILFVDPKTRRAYSNYPDSAGVMKKDGDIYTGILPAKVILANASISWNGIVWAMIMVLPPTYLYTNKHDRINLLTHELFHVAQPSLNFPRQNELNNNHLDKKDGRIWLRMELEALKKAVQSTGKNEMHEQLANAMIFRRYRYLLFPGSDTSENILELNEGITEYTGAIMAGRNKKNAIAHFVKKINDFLVNPAYVRTFPYYTIPVYGWLLRNRDKFWNKEITPATNLADYFSMKFNFSIPADLKKTVDAISVGYDLRNIVKEESAREEKTKKLILEYKKRFLEQPVFEIPFYKKSIGFDSRYIMPLEDHGIVYPTMTASDTWGTLKVESGGGLLSPNRDKLTLSIPIKIETNEANGDGWKLILNEGFEIIKNDSTGNYKLIKK